MLSGTTSCDVVIAGGGPAGLMAGLLFARSGARTIVLEKHTDFLRDFRGDTVHPSTLQLFAELGLLDQLLQRPHDRVDSISGQIGGDVVRLADFSHLPVQCGFIAMMPQWHFLDFIAEEARKFPNFQLMMPTEVTGLNIADDLVTGLRTSDGQVDARLVIIASGRGTPLCEEAGLQRRDFGAPMDVLWFRVPKERTDSNRTAGRFDRGRILVLIDRGEYWQVGYVIPKGGAEKVRAQGLDAFKASLSRAAPVLDPGLAAINDWDAVKLLEVKVDRLDRWWRPGLLAIGDAAHAMSPIGGVGINLAVQDAVAAANILAAGLAAGADVTALLADVQRRRWWPTKATQGVQLAVQKRIIGSVLKAEGGEELLRAPTVARLVDGLPPLQRLIGRAIGMGFRPEHIKLRP